MYNNDYMYAIERSDEYLAHYGVRGMKWGVRKAREMGGARGARKMSHQYAKASKKLAKLEKRAASGKKYARRAAVLGAGAAAAGGLAAVGTSGVQKGLSKIANRLPGSQAGLAKAAGRIGAWGNKTSIGTAAANAGSKGIIKGAQLERKLVGGSKGLAEANVKALNTTNKLRGVSNNTLARLGAGAIGAGLAVGAARNAYKAATTKKAARKAEQFRKEMNTAFKGTKYANGGNRSVTPTSNKPRQGKKRRK